MKKLTHYGQEVIYQQLLDTGFRDALRKKGIDYTDLPIVDDDVLMYTMDGITKYVCIVKGNSPDTYVENTYMTTQIPVDMSWDNLVDDCKGQLQGEDPMPLKTKVNILCESALQIAREASPDTDIFSAFPAVNARDFNFALTSLGYALDDIMEMDHHDISDDFLKEMRIC